MPGDSMAPGGFNRARRAEHDSRRFLVPPEPRSPAARERWRLIVRGKVQGVGYRASCLRRATDLGLSGWVRNMGDGTVEVEAEGTIQALTELRLWCEKGPRHAQVSNVANALIPATGSDWFEIRP